MRTSTGQINTNQDTSHVRAMVVSTEVREEGEGLLKSRGYVIYHVSVHLGNVRSWMIKRRFRNFEHLNRKLREKNEKFRHKLPPKSLFNHLDGNSFFI